MKLQFPLVVIMMLCACVMTAQDVEFPALDASPMDAAHYPSRSAFANYLDADDPDRTQKIKVLYSRPNKKGRAIFGELIPYGKLWRLGANEAQEVSFYTPVEIGGTYVAAGTYTMFADINQDHWVFKLSSERFIAGTSNLDESKVFLATKIMTESVKDVREAFTIGFQRVDDDHADMLFEWDQTRARLPISFNPPSMAGDDASPMDLAAYPASSRFRNFQKPEDFDKSAPQIRVIYSRPQMKGREIFGGLVKYDQVWRMGANQTTVVTFFQNVKIGDKEISKGQYGIFVKPTANSWDFIIHKNTQSWGSANHDDKENVVTISAPTAKTPSTLEALSITFQEKGDNMVDMVVGWENTMARLPIQIVK